MIIIPRVDLRPPDSPGLANPRDPRDLIHEWEWAGFQSVQVVEPDNRDDRPFNRRHTEELLREARIRVQVAGDIRSADDIEALVSAGATSVVLGPRALDETDWLESAVAAFPDLLVVASAARERRVRTRGMVRTLPVDIRDLAQELSNLPLAGLLMTFGGDATLDHSDLALIEDVAESMAFPLMIGGGAQTMSTLRDLEFRGAFATVIDAARLADSFDEQTLARSFVD